MSRAKYFTPSEVAVHNTSSDCWVSFLGNVYDLTPLCEEHSGNVLLKPIVAHAGKDISHWFDPRTKDIKTHIDPITSCVAPYTPMGRFVHIPPSCPRSDWSNNFGIPWWRNESYNIGKLTEKTRKIRLINTLTLQEQTIEVCSEETMMEILSRYLIYNTHAASYTWKYNGEFIEVADCLCEGHTTGNNLDMTKTLQQNGITDESEMFYELKMDEDEFLPAIHLYFNDDLTEF